MNVIILGSIGRGLDCSDELYRSIYRTRDNMCLDRQMLVWGYVIDRTALPAITRLSVSSIQAPADTLRKSRSRPTQILGWSWMIGAPRSA